MDAGMARIGGLTKVERPGLQNTKVADAGLEELEGLTNLKVPWRGGSAITQEAADRFRAG